MAIHPLYANLRDDKPAKQNSCPCNRVCSGDVNTTSCGDAAGESSGLDIQTSAIRLVGGSADVSGQWEYGRLEALIDGFWTALDEQTSSDNFGRRGAQVACETLGYATGAQLLAGAASALPSFSYEAAFRRSADCDGTEDSFSDCYLDYDGYFRVQANVDGLSVDDVALLCVNPSGAAPLHLDTQSTAPSRASTCYPVQERHICYL